MRILVCGDRNWTDVSLIRKTLEHVYEEHGPFILIEGEARGADKISAEIGSLMGLAIVRFPAQWNKYGRSAGPRRNQQMLDEGKPDLVIAFHDNILQSKGTAHMVRIAQKANVETIVISHKED